MLLCSAITTQGADTEEQHYECSSGLGQDWFGTAVEVNPEAALHNAAKGCSSIVSGSNNVYTDTNGEHAVGTLQHKCSVWNG